MQLLCVLVFLFLVFFCNQAPGDPIPGVVLLLACFLLLVSGVRHLPVVARKGVTAPRGSPLARWNQGAHTGQPRQPDRGPRQIRKRRTAMAQLLWVLVFLFLVFFCKEEE